ncbi:MAG: pyridoxamine 5'-phosphate oxidase [Alphaproteobacteria bacterium]|nr:pyridoxamine 5'-phosphate oxidase [Alphaproteobacteria bacterium]
MSSETDPFAHFEQWYAQARESEPDVPEAMALATVDASGVPDVRMVLMKAHGPDGFVFYSNSESAKGEQLAANPQAALCFHWKSLGRQVRIRGPVEQVSAAQANAYFDSRDRGSRIGAWASKQSRPLEGRFALEKAVASYATRYAVGRIPRPDYWNGYRVVPHSIEFWQHRDHRLHERQRFSRTADGWNVEWLYP